MLVWLGVMGFRAGPLSWWPCEGADAKNAAGAMLAVSLAQRRSTATAGRRVGDSSNERAGLCSVAGPLDEVAELQQRLKIKGWRASDWRTRTHFTALVEPVMGHFPHRWRR